MALEINGLLSSINEKDYTLLESNDIFLDNLTTDISTIPQLQLDLSNRVKTNLFEWRGQFSPELIEILLTNYAYRDSIILDPFVGCGTTLLECAYQELTCYGIDVNPSAYEISKTAEFANMPTPERLEVIKNCEQILLKNCPNELSWVSNINDDFADEDKINDSFKSILKESIKCGEYERNFNLNVIMRYHNIKKKNIKNKLFYAFNTHKSVVLRNIPYTNVKIKAINCDVRKMPFDDGTVDLIITSPPYINVFNYHQNYREVMELFREDILDIAKSEIGSNRKNRGNRYLSVIQYSIDMCTSLNEMKRVLNRDGRIIIIIGRESKIMGVKYENYKILSTLATLCCGLKLVIRQKRQFTTRFGKDIIEDILHFKIDENADQYISPTEVGKYYLYRSLNVANVTKKSQIIDAIKLSEQIKPSPLFTGQT